MPPGQKFKKEWGLINYGQVGKKINWRGLSQVPNELQNCNVFSNEPFLGNKEWIEIGDCPQLVMLWKY